MAERITNPDGSLDVLRLAFAYADRGWITPQAAMRAIRTGNIADLTPDEHDDDSNQQSNA